MKKLKPLSRIIIAIASLLLIATYFLPIWQIDLVAPQYPEGLMMQIWLNKFSGQVDIINGLNHYIGMKHIKADMFPEFGYLIYIVGGFIALGLLVALLGRIKFLAAYVLLLLAGGVAAMVDFYLWAYDYGHNLDPAAAIQVPGFSYQPPLIGHKKLLNFDAYSFPASGGWVIVVAGLAIIAVLIVEWRRNRKNKISPLLKGTVQNTGSYAAVLLMALGLSACQSGPQPIAIGKDGCAFCKMTIMSPQFGAEIVTSKGKIFKFDDLHCLKSFIKKGEVKESDIAQTLTVDYEKEQSFLEVQKAWFVVSENLRSPMNSHAAGFATKDAAGAAAQKLSGEVLDWNSLYKRE